jgi:hypothetical protein
MTMGERTPIYFSGIADLQRMAAGVGTAAEIERFAVRLQLRNDVADHLRGLLARILDRASKGDEDAQQAWRRIEREMRAPLRAVESDERPFMPAIDRLAIVVALAEHFLAKNPAPPSRLCA